MVERIRCPRCSTVFPTSARPRCPHCGLVGRVQPAPKPRSARRDRMVAAVAVVVLLVFAGLVTGVLYGGSDAQDAGPGPAASAGVARGLGAVSTGVHVNDTLPGANVTLVAPNASVGGTGPVDEPPAALFFDGTGDERTRSFVTERGLLRVQVAYRGDGFFGASFAAVDDANATRRTLLAPTEGDHDATRFLGLAPGRYVLDVASGDDVSAWSVRIDQPGADDVEPLPAQATGSGDAAAMVLAMPRGEATFQTTHTAPHGEFVVRLYDAHGNLVRRGASEAVVSAFGDHDGAARMTIPADGVYFVDVHAAGDWSLSVRR